MAPGGTGVVAEVYDGCGEARQLKA